MMGLQHFFDNRLGGSLHGESQAGLTPFGEQAVRNMQKKGIMIDVAHSSEATVRDTLRVTEAMPSSSVTLASMGTAPVPVTSVTRPWR